MENKFYIEFTLSDFGISNFRIKNLPYLSEQMSAVALRSREDYQNLLAKNQIQLVIQELRVSFPHNGMLVNLSAQWQAIENQFMIGALLFKDTIPFRARICQSLVELLEELLP